MQKLYHIISILVIICIFVCIIMLSGMAAAEQKKIRIVICREQDAQNWAVEEAFFAVHPDVEIEYLLYSEDQVYSRLMAKTIQADLVILPYNMLLSMTENGYIRNLEDAASLHEYPNQLLDLHALLTKNDNLFALPVSIYQEYWCWDETVGKKVGLDYPGENYSWNWEDYAALAESFPYDTDQDGINDTYLTYGECVPACSMLKNASLGMLFEYVSTYKEFSTFMEEYLELFRKIVIDDALLDMFSLPETDAHVLLSRMSTENPIEYMLQDSSSGEAEYRFLRPPTLNGEGPYSGYLWGCGILTDAISLDLSIDFINAILSDHSLDYAAFMRYDQIISSECPVYEYLDLDHQYDPVFVPEGDIHICRVRSGREFEIAEFPFSQEAFEVSQDFRSQLSLHAIPYAPDFYQASYALLQEWLKGQMSDAEFEEKMNYLLGLASGV